MIHIWDLGKLQKVVDLEGKKTESCKYSCAFFWGPPKSLRVNFILSGRSYFNNSFSRTRAAFRANYSILLKQGLSKYSTKCYMNGEILQYGW